MAQIRFKTADYILKHIYVEMPKLFTFSLLSIFLISDLFDIFFFYVSYTNN